MHFVCDIFLTQALTKVQTLQVATDECVEAQAALYDMDTCLPIAASVRAAPTLADAVALADELCATCDANALGELEACFTL